MIYSIILITIPTSIVSFLISKAMGTEKLIILNIVLYYFYLIGSAFLIMAGTTDPGIFERQEVNLSNLKF